ncbi:MAG: aspartate carbamoyltransferase [Chlamydiota bacterium]
MKSLISISDLSKEAIEEILKSARTFKQTPQQNLLKGRILASCFFEPSTRTRLSFETAMLRLGGHVIGFSEEASTSIKKGETLSDTLRMISAYADVIILRHKNEGAARLAAEISDKPVINAGDGGHEHPSQTLLDLFTIQETQKKLDGLHIAVTGDLKYARTAHSLIQACALFNIRLSFICTEKLSLPEQILLKLRKNSVKFSFHRSLEEVLPNIDILYMTRLQKERYEENHKNPFILRADMLHTAQPNLKILHPLPRLQEIATCVDSTPHAHYFEQAANALPVRQALLTALLN